MGSEYLLKAPDPEYNANSNPQTGFHLHPHQERATRAGTTTTCNRTT
jgi:hypothetical protein